MKNSKYKNEKPITDRIADILSHIWCVPVFFLSICTFLYGLTTSVTYELRQEIDLQTTSHDGRLSLVCVTALVLAILYLLMKRTRFFTHERRYPVWILFGFVTAFSLYLIFGVRGLATNDALQLDAIANAFLDGDFTQLKETGSYLYVYPFQLGYVAYCEGMATLFGRSNYLAHQIVNLFAVLITLFFLLKTTKRLFPDSFGIVGMAAALACGMLFLPLYTTFVYGDIVSLAPQSAAMYLVVRFLGEERSADAIAAGVLFGVSWMLKTNTAIAVTASVIAVLLFLVFKDGGKEKRKGRLRPLVLVIIMVVLARSGPLIVNAYFSGVSGASVPAGVPSSAYFAMGIQDNGYGQAGWYNGYNAGVYRDNGYDRERTDEAARARFKEDFASLAESPSRLLKFYGRKYLTQWGDASCISLRELELSSRHVEGHSAVINSVIYGKGRSALYFAMQVSHLLLWLGTATSLFVLRKGRTGEMSFILLYIFGGMLFHELWEASSRYTMRYLIFLLPFAAHGLFVLINSVRSPSRVSS